MKLNILEYNTNVQNNELDSPNFIVYKDDNLNNLEKIIDITLDKQKYIVYRLNRNLFNNFVQLGDIILKENEKNYRLLLANKDIVQYPYDYKKVLSLPNTNIWQPITDKIGIGQVASLAKPMIKMIGVIDKKYIKEIGKNYNFMNINKKDTPILLQDLDKCYQDICLESSYPWWDTIITKPIKKKPKNSLKYIKLLFIFIMVSIFIYIIYITGYANITL